jgi:hypothetical protein
MFDRRLKPEGAGSSRQVVVKRASTSMKRMNRIKRILN